MHRRHDVGRHAEAGDGRHDREERGAEVEQCARRPALADEQLLLTVRRLAQDHAEQPVERQPPEGHERPERLERERESAREQRVERAEPEN